MTVVYLENLGFPKLGQVSNDDNVAWLRQQGYQVIEMDYEHSDKAVSPALFYHNTDDFYADNNKDPQGLYATQARLMKEKLDALGVATAAVTGYSTGHAVPQTDTDLQQMYDFLLNHVKTPTDIQEIGIATDDIVSYEVFDLSGRRLIAQPQRGFIYLIRATDGQGRRYTKKVIRYN